jgi:hypothetical protein
MKCPSTRTLSKRSAAEWATLLWLAKKGRSPNEDRCRLGCEIGEEGYGCPEKHGCLRQAQVPLFVAT